MVCPERKGAAVKREDEAPLGRILVVEDDPSLNEVVCSFLRLRGYACTAAFSGTEGRMLLERDTRAFDLVVCDLMLPGASGEELIAEVRAGAASAVPIVVVSAKGSPDDRVALLRLGADDYLVKPFQLEELLARIEVQLRHAARGRGPEPSGVARTFGDWRASSTDRVLWVNGVPVKLTRTEFDIVWLLMGSPNRVFTRHQLIEAVRGNEDAREEKTASTHVGNIRAKLKGTGTTCGIETVWGIGFKLCTCEGEGT